MRLRRSSRCSVCGSRRGHRQGCPELAWAELHTCARDLADALDRIGRDLDDALGARSADPALGPDAMRWAPSEQDAAHGPQDPPDGPWAASVPRSSLTCPRCRRTSFHPEDVRYGWCGACEAYTSARAGSPASDVVAYRGHRGWSRPEAPVVQVNRVGGVGESLPHVCRHSPDGFEWGYAGSGPSDLALSLLTYHLGYQPEPGLYHAFRDTVVANLDHARWTLTADYVDDWLARHRVW